MLFLFLFMVGGLVIPVMIDVQKHGSDNIFRRSGRDLLDYEITQSTLRLFHVSAKRISTTLAGALSFASIIGLVWISKEVVDIVRFVATLLGK